jgi:riboflavin biosynthesis pyrimidine reductase
MFGGAELAWVLIRNDLVDEYRIMVTPAILGDGKPLFGGSHSARQLQLVSARTLDVGSVILHYRRVSGVE